MHNNNHIRNFAIIAHVDHGKSTLADRLMEITGTVKPGSHDEQMLDRNPISRERGITIKLAPVTVEYISIKGKKYLLNLIDTPGHVDFSYEVDRTLACVEGVVLLVDATQGMQAQTIAHVYRAIHSGAQILPVINKIDSRSAQIAKTEDEIIRFLGIKKGDILHISAKTGQGVNELIEKICEFPEPSQKYADNNKTSALIFDSYYDPYKGVIAFVRIFGGSIEKGKKMHLLATNTIFEAQEVGIFKPELKKTNMLFNGMIGYIATNLKNIHTVRVGDTICEKNKKAFAIPGYREPKPVVFASVFPTDANYFPALKKAFDKLSLNDSSIVYEPIYSRAFGAGFRAGFLGLLHAEVSRERLEREFRQDIIFTPPQIEYKVKNGIFYEPIVNLTIVTPTKYMGAVMKLCEESRGEFKSMDNAHQVVIAYIMPLSEIVTHFFSRLKAISSGYASLDWEFLEYRPVDADKLFVLLNKDEIEEFSEIVPRERSYERAKKLTSSLKKAIPRQQFEVKIQAVYKNRIIASERIAPFRKDVTQKLYGGDRTRKDKLLSKQKKGKKLMKQVGKVDIPKEAFVKLFSDTD